MPPLALAAAAGAAQCLWTARPTGVRRAAVAAALAGGSAALAAWSVREFRRSRTTVNPMSPERATSLVVGGPHRWSRNPMYVGMAGVLAAHAVARGRWAAVVPVVGFVTVMDRVQIPQEEAALSDAFGDSYAAYAAQVPRWLRFPTR